MLRNYLYQCCSKDVQNTLYASHPTFFHPTTELKVFADTGANLCLMYPNELQCLGLSQNQLTPCQLPVSVVGRSSVNISGRIRARIDLAGQSTVQTVFFCNTADRFFLGRRAHKDLKIIQLCFPFPSPLSSRTSQPHLPACLYSIQHLALTPRDLPPQCPKSLPYQPIPANVPLLMQYLLNAFATSAFNVSKPFPKLSIPPVRIHLKPNYVIPSPAYTPALVADHWEEAVKASLDDNEDSRILKGVAYNEPVEFCSRMACVKKKDGFPRQTVDF